MPAPVDQPAITHLSLVPWPDPVIDEVGHDPRSAYVERFWLGAIGPSCTWLLRLLAERFEAEPEGFVLDVADCARSIGLGAGLGRNAPFGRTVNRVCLFGLARRYGHDGLVVRRRLPPLARHQVLRLPERLQEEHQRWLDMGAQGTLPPVATPEPAGGAAPHERARRAEEAGRRALELLDSGADPASAPRRLVVEHHTPPALAHAALGWALSRRRARLAAVPAAAHAAAEPAVAAG
jgi:hypothetical protein